jgi:zona occludens toxin (predicted ATPase)
MNLYELTPVTATLVFLGVPLAIFGLIWLSVLLASRGRTRRAREASLPATVAADPPPGIEPAAAKTDAAKTDAADPPPSWTVHCTVCVQRYRRNGATTQFDNPQTAIRAALRHEWRVHPSGMRCPGCTRVGLIR